MNLSEKIKDKKVEKNHIALFWLGQAGFIIKDSVGRNVLIDPYLTDYCERVTGFKRLSPKLIKPEEIKTDLLFVSHNHPDHFDVDAVPIIMEDGHTQFVGPQSAVQGSINLGISKQQLSKIDVGETLDFGWIRLEAVYADHGELAPDAIGVIITMAGIKVYYAGDTAYRPEKMQIAIAARPDIIIVPINGAFGNMDAREAAYLVRDTGAKYAIPCHYWTFAVHGGNPQAFDDIMKADVPGSRAVFLCPGEAFSYMGG